MEGIGSPNSTAPADGTALESSPTDQVLLQEQGQQKFLGNLLWDAFNLVTFGAFEKKKAKRPAETPPPPQNEQNRTHAQSEPKKDEPKEMKTMSKDEYHNLMRQVVEVREERKRLEQDRQDVQRQKQKLLDEEEDESSNSTTSSAARRSKGGSSSSGAKSTAQATAKVPQQPRAPRGRSSQYNMTSGAKLNRTASKSTTSNATMASKPMAVNSTKPMELNKTVNASAKTEAKLPSGANTSAAGNKTGPV